jgi:peptide/nickel transport system substrate-binding protein
MSSGPPDPRHRGKAVPRRALLAQAGRLAGGLALGAAYGSSGRPSPAAAAAVQPRRGGVLRFALNTDPPKLDPAASGPTGAIDSVCSMVYSRLVNYTPDVSGVVPDLAEKWDVSPDGRSYTFTLRRGVVWHDGKPLTAEDVKFSFERLLDPKTAAPFAPSFGPGVRVEAPDAATVRFALPSPNAAFLAMLAVPQCSIVSKAFVDAGNSLADTMMGTGPFVFRDHQPAVQLRLTRNPRYYVQGRPHLDGITFLFFRDSEARVAALKTKAADIMDFVPFPDQAGLEATPGMRLYYDKETNFFDFRMRQDREPFGNVKVRQALSCAVDRQAAIKAALDGRGTVVTGGPLWKASWAYSPEVKQIYPYDPERAKKLLADAGYPKGFKTTILSNTSFAMHQNTAVTVQAGFKAIGVEADLRLYDFPTYNQKFVTGDFDVGVGTVIPSYGDPDFLWSYFHSKSLWGRNLGLHDSQMDDWLDRARAGTRQAERKTLYINVQKRLMETVPIVFLMTRDYADAAWAYLKNYVHIPGYSWSGERAQEWWLDK